MVNKTITLFSYIGKPQYKKDTIKALQVSKERFNFDKVICASCCDIEDDSIEVFKINESTAQEYNHFMVKKLNDLITTDFVMTVQDDGFIINEDAWDEKFLDYDYIGSLWGTNQKYRVGNGGFSIRSKKFLEIASSVMINNSHELRDWDDCFTQFGEDVFLTRMLHDHLEQLGITYATPEVARYFSVECPEWCPEHAHVKHDDLSTYREFFGFHGRNHVKLLKKYHGDLWWKEYIGKGGMREDGV